MTTLIHIISAIASGLLLAFALPGSLTGILAGIALIPLLRILLTEDISLGRAVSLGWLCGLIAYGIHFSYVIVALHPLIFFLALVYVAFYTAIFSAGVVFCTRRNPEWGCLLVPCLWTALEFIRAHILTGLQASTLGASQAQIPPVVQIAAITGVFGLSFLLVALNVALTRLIQKQIGIPRYTLIWLGSVGTMLIGTLGYGWGKLNTDPGMDTLRVATVQGEIDERGLDHDMIRRQIFSQYRQHTVKLTDFQPDIIVYPETMTGSYLTEDSLFLSFLMDMGTQTGSAFIVGSRHIIEDSTHYNLFNSAFLINEKGHIQGRYDKVRLVPFGEYTPFGMQWPWLTRYRLSPSELSPGLYLHPLQLEEGLPIGVGICYEAMYGTYIREVVNNGARILSIISDDFWFEGTNESQQYFNEAILRAIENRIPVVRTANMGTSGIIDAYGRVSSTESPSFRPYVTYGSVHLRNEISIYTRYGDVLPWICIFITAGLLFLCLKPHTKNKL